MSRLERALALVSQVVAVEGGRWGMETDMASRMRLYMAVDRPGMICGVFGVGGLVRLGIGVCGIFSGCFGWLVGVKVVFYGM